ncbi:MAG: DUF4124 domain-containing protein [Gammaproteobacteria bacterium]|nr:DUF4124 domain-containing protein [Gammaproteobacteria bacterium]
MRFTSLILTIALIFSTGLLADKKVYRWVDEAGNVHFSDVPVEGGKEITLKGVSSISNDNARTGPLDLSKLPNKGQQPKNLPASKDSKFNSFQDSEKKEAAKQLADEVYEEVKITSPEDESAVRNNAAIVEISASVKPKLFEGHTLVFELDGKEVENESGGFKVTVENVEYGDHSVRVKVVDELGVTIEQSKSVKFYLLNRINPEIRKKQKAQFNRN